MVSFYYEHGGVAWAILLNALVLIGGAWILFINILKRKRAESMLRQTREHLELQTYERTQELRTMNEQLEQEIQERKRAELESHELHERFLKTFAVNPTPMALSTIAEGRFFEVNESFLRCLKFERDEVIGHTSAELGIFSPESRGRFLEIMKDQGAIHDVERQLITKDGDPVDIVWSAAPVTVQDEQFIISAFVDITARKRIEGAVRESEERLRAIAESTPDAIVTADDSNSIVYWNRGAEKIFGYTQEEILGRSALLLLPEHLREQNKQAFDSFKKSGSPCFTGAILEAAAVRKSGEEFPVEQSYSTWQTHGRVFFTSIIRDITERRQYMNQLKLEKERTEKLIEISVDPIIICDSAGRILQANKSFLAMLGCSKEEVLGKVLHNFTAVEAGTYESTTGEVVVIDDEYHQKNSEIVMHLFEDGIVTNWETYCINRSGRLIPITHSIALLYDEAGEISGSFAVIRDITAHRRAELELIQAKVAAEEANQAKSRFLANMSHEIRTPMNAVIGFTDMLLETPLNPEQTDYVSIIKRSGDSLISLINDILDFSKIEAGRIDFENIDFDIELLAHDVCELIRPRTEGKPVEILCRIDENLPAQVNGDPYRFKQVLINLMGNAAKFTERGEIELSLAAVAEQDGRFTFHATVRDTGRGIPGEKLESIFDAFQQGDESTTRTFGGTGLGLSICRTIAERMRGEVWAESEPGRGSIFHFTAQLSSALNPQVQRCAPVSLRGKRVLVVDDNRTNLTIIARILSACGMQIEAYTQGAEALSALQAAARTEAPFDLCILDIVMPDMSGYDLAHHIRSTVSSTIPLLAVSASVGRGGAQQCRKAGINGFLPKPVNRIKLLKMMERLLGTAQGTRQPCAEEPGLMTQYSLRENTKQTISILLAEDNPVNQKLAVTMFNKAGYRVVVAGSGREALDKLFAAPAAYDIVLMDIQMPEVDGLEATRILRSRGFEKIPIIAMTANAMKGDRERCLAAGMNDYIAKPIKREMVFDILNRWVIDSEQHIRSSA